MNRRQGAWASATAWCRVPVVTALAWLIAVSAASAACTVSVTSNVAFGTYDVFSPTPLDSAGQLRWRCDILTFPSVRITMTKGASQTYLPRRLRSGTALLDYNLYLDAARARVWGDGTEGTQFYSQQYWGLGWTTVSIFGRVPASQDPSVGTYSDSITIVINY